MSNHEIYDIGIKILYEPSFDHNSTQKAPFPKKKYQRYYLVDVYNSTVSKRDLKPSGTFIEKMHATLDSQLVLMTFLDLINSKVSTHLYNILN